MAPPPGGPPPPCAAPMARGMAARDMGPSNKCKKKMGKRIGPSENYGIIGF